MAFLRDELLNQKIMEAEAEVIKIMEENNISEDTMIQGIVLDKEVFQTIEEAVEWIKVRGYFHQEFEETDTQFIFSVRDAFQFGELATLEIRRGVNLLIGELRPLDNMPTATTGFDFSLKDLGELKFNDTPHIIEVAKVISGVHPRYGEVEITETDLKNMLHNFKTKVTGVDLSINKDHEKVEALGWFKDVFLSFDGKTLYAEINWNPKGVTALKDKSFRYFSPEFSFNYVHPHSGKSHGATLVGGALTNYPFLKMNPITDMNNKNETNGENEMETISLKSHEEKITEFNTKISTLEEEIGKGRELVTNLNEKNQELNDEISKMKEEKELAEKNAKFEKLFSENTINKAQLEALKDGKDLMEVLSLNTKMNVEGTGADANTEDKDFSAKLSEADKAAAKAFGLTNEEYFNANNK